MGLNKLNHNYNQPLDVIGITSNYSITDNLSAQTSNITSASVSNLNASAITATSLNGVSVSSIISSSTLSIVPAKTSAYTIQLGDKDKFLELNGTFTISIPTDAVTDFPIGSQVNILNIGSGTITIAAVTGGTTTVNGTPGLLLRAQWSGATLIKRAANNWVVAGDLKAS
jgi:hypothetical protein